MQLCFFTMQQLFLFYPIGHTPHCKGKSLEWEMKRKEVNSHNLIGINHSLSLLEDPLPALFVAKPWTFKLNPISL